MVGEIKENNITPNKKVIKTMIYLCWSFLIIYALMKTIFDDKFVVIVNNYKLINIGYYVDTHIWLQQIIYGITTLITYQFYLCACIKKWFMKPKQYIALCVIIVITNTIKYYVPTLSIVLNVLIMIILPYALKAEYKTFIIIFVAHYIGQMVVGYVRCDDMLLANANTLTSLIISLDAYIWLILYYLYSNLYKENIIMGNLMPPLWGKMSNTIIKEIEKIDKKLMSETDIKKIEKLKNKKTEYEKLLKNCD